MILLEKSFVNNMHTMNRKPYILPYTQAVSIQTDCHIMLLGSSTAPQPGKTNAPVF